MVDVAQFGRAPGCGPGGRGFESHHPPHSYTIFSILNHKGPYMFWELLFGVLLILWGISYITESVFHIHIPVFGIVFGLFLLYLGVEVISGFSHWPKNGCTHCNASSKQANKSSECRVTTMSSSHITVDDNSLAHKEAPWEYKTIMGTSRLDLSELTPQALRAAGTTCTINSDTIFGSTEILLPKNVPVRIIAKSCCAHVVTPDDCAMVFGSHTYNSHKHEQPLLLIYSSTICGKTIIINAQ